VFARGRLESFVFCARFRFLVAVLGVFDPPVRVIRAFLALVLGFSTLVEILDFRPLLMLTAVLIGFVSASLVGSEVGW
jgi:hypothetical protein